VPDETTGLAAIARGIIDANLYMTLGTVDDAGRPWVSPVYFAHDRYAAFYWISSPEVSHSRNIAQRPQISIVVFDSKVPAYAGQAVYMAAMASEVPAAELEHGLSVYPGPPERGARRMAPEQLQAPAEYRLYRAVVSEHWTLCPRASGPCVPHGLAYDHRTTVTL
jgi:hypothetical protein